MPCNYSREPSVPTQCFTFNFIISVAWSASSGLTATVYQRALGTLQTEYRIEYPPPSSMHFETSLLSHSRAQAHLGRRMVRPRAPRPAAQAGLDADALTSIAHQEARRERIEVRPSDCTRVHTGGHLHQLPHHAVEVIKIAGARGPAGTATDGRCRSCRYQRASGRPD